MERNIMVANIVGLVLFTIGIILYVIGVFKDNKSSWKTTIGFLIAVVGGVVVLTTCGAFT